MDAGFNMTNKHIDCQTLVYTEKRNIVSPDQYGNHKHRKSINVVLNKVLLNDILRQKRHTGAIGMNDTRGYYDRIVHSIVILLLMSLEVWGQIVRALFKVLQEVDYHIKSGFGRSSRVYGNGTIPHQGTCSGQENSLGPTLWKLIATKLIMMMLVKKHGFQLLSATSLTLISLVCFVFVDNTNLPVTAEHHSVGEDIAPLFQDA